MSSDPLGSDPDRPPSQPANRHPSSVGLANRLTDSPRLIDNFCPGPTTKPSISTSPQPEGWTRTPRSTFSDSKLGVPNPILQPAKSRIINGIANLAMFRWLIKIGYPDWSKLLSPRNSKSVSLPKTFDSRTHAGLQSVLGTTGRFRCACGDG